MEDIRDIRATISDVVNEMPVTQTGNSVHRKITPTRTVTDLTNLIEVSLHDLHDFSHESNDRHIAHLCEEVRRNVEKSELLKPSDQSIENNMLRYLPDGMTNDQIYAYYNAITDFTQTLTYMVDVGISELSEGELARVLTIVNLNNRNEVIENLQQNITTIMKDCRRRNFRQCMQYMSTYYNLCILWDIVVLYLSCIFSINSGHSNNIIKAEMGVIDRQRREDKNLIKCFVQPRKETVLFTLLYTNQPWLPVQAFLDSHDMKSESLDPLCNGQFTIAPLEHGKAKIFMSMFFSCLRWSESNEKWTKFTFKKTTEAGKTYFRIYSADYPDYYITLDLFSLLVRGKEGDPEGCNNGMWVIERLEDNGDECYVLCTKDSNGNCLTADYTHRVYGNRGVINKKKMWLIRKSNSFNGDSTSQLMQTM